MLPRLLAYLDDATARRDDLGILLAAVAAHGPDVAIVSRLPGGTTDAHAALTSRALANARPAGARVYVTGRADLAAATGAHGVIARVRDLPIADLRHLIPHHPILASVHSLDEARTAVSSGADGVVIGNIWDTPTHPGRPALGVDLLRRVAALGLPTWAIGGVTPERAREARDAGAHGVAAISALWSERRPYAAAGALLDGIRFPGES